MRGVFPVFDAVSVWFCQLLCVRLLSSAPRWCSVCTLLDDSVFLRSALCSFYALFYAFDDCFVRFFMLFLNIYCILCFRLDTNRIMWLMQWELIHQNTPNKYIESLQLLTVKPDDGRCRPKHVVSFLLYIHTYTTNKLCYWLNTPFTSYTRTTGMIHLKNVLCT